MRYPVPRPTENQAIGRASRRSASTAPVPVLRDRLVVAIAVADAHGVLLLAHHIRRADQ